MPSDSYRPRRLFTIEQANATLPLVRAIVSDMVDLARDIQERRHRLHVLTTGREVRKNDPYSGELVQIEADLDRDVLKLRDYARELHEIGAEAKDPVIGLVDFPMLMDGRIVYLCWKLGENEILHWHELDAGFSGRQPLTADTLAGGSDDKFSDDKFEAWDDE